MQDLIQWDPGHSKREKRHDVCAPSLLHRSSTRGAPHAKRCRPPSPRRQTASSCPSPRAPLGSAQSLRNWLEQLTNSTDKETYELCWDPHPAGGALTLHSEKHFRKQTMGPSVHEVTPSTSRGTRPTEFLIAVNPRVRTCEGAPPYRLRQVRKTIKEKRLVPGGFDQNKGRQTVQFSLVNRLDENPNKK